MSADQLEIFRRMLATGSANSGPIAPVAPESSQSEGSIEPSDGGNYSVKVPPGNIGGGGGKSGNETPVGGGGMDAWQTSVEGRLGTLDMRLGRIEDKIGTASTDIATMKERISHLPRKGYINTALIALLLGIAALTAFADKVQSLVASG